MLKQLKRMHSLSRKVGSNLKLLHRDPELFARNLLQFTNPSRFEQQLIDVLHAAPMHVRFEADRDEPPRLNVLDSAWTQSGMTGGPNTVINLAVRIAREGIAVRLVSTVQPPTVDPAWFQRHAASLVGGDRLPEVPIVSAADANTPLQVGPRDVFLATHWTTAQQLKAVLPRLPIQQFFYMLQEFEPGFYAWSSNYARALETYGMDFWPIINEAMLADYLLSQPLGRLSDPVMRDRAVVFEPAVDETLFHLGPDTAPARPKRLLFYARPTNTRNMFGLGLMALREVAADPAFKDWEFLSIGSRGSVPDDLQLGHGHVLRRAPWMDYAGYGDLLRQADLLLCPMLSPHTSYPVLEMAACGGVSVTNVFVTKTRAGLENLSGNIIAVEPTVAGFGEGLLAGARKINAAPPRRASLNMARNWGAVLDPAAHRVAEILRSMQTAHEGT
jgi:O-antigen biosynthesis protein